MDRSKASCATHPEWRCHVISLAAPPAAFFQCVRPTICASSSPIRPRRAYVKGRAVTRLWPTNRPFRLPPLALNDPSTDRRHLPLRKLNPTYKVTTTEKRRAFPFSFSLVPARTTDSARDGSRFPASDASGERLAVIESVTDAALEQLERPCYSFAKLRVSRTHDFGQASRGVTENNTSVGESGRRETSQSCVDDA